MTTPGEQVFDALQDADYWADAISAIQRTSPSHKEVADMYNENKLPRDTQNAFYDLRDDPNPSTYALEDGSALPQIDAAEGLLRLTVDRLELGKRPHFQRIRRAGGAVTDLIDRVAGSGDTEADYRKYVSRPLFAARVERMDDELLYAWLAARYRGDNPTGGSFIISRTISYGVTLPGTDKIVAYPSWIMRSDRDKNRKSVTYGPSIFENGYRVGQNYMGQTTKGGYYTRVNDAVVIRRSASGLPVRNRARAAAKPALGLVPHRA